VASCDSASRIAAANAEQAILDFMWLFFISGKLAALAPRRI
jgi:hypothetical protein